ncbi:hypothetical protein ACX80S_12020 [Arthrobacter sp. RHLT1-20]
MPWWSWIVIWIALVALSLLLFVVLGVRLFRQFMTTVRELGEAGERFSSFPSAPAGPGSAAVHIDAVDFDGAGTDAASGAHAAPGSAVFAPPARMRHEYDASKLARQEARRLRRVRRKTDRGQPQALRDIEFS